MVELKLEPLDGELDRDFYVSVRVGEVQKLSRISSSRSYKFPASAAADRKFGKIEIFKKIGGASVGIVPESHNGVDQQVSLQLDDNSEVKFKVSLSGEGGKLQPGQKSQPPEDKARAKEVNPKVQAAKSYLEMHNLEMRLSEAMQAVLREKPEDPAAFVAERLAKSAGMVQRTPKVEQAPAAEQALATPPATEKAPAPSATAEQAPSPSPAAEQAPTPSTATEQAPVPSPAAQQASTPSAAAPAREAPKVLPFASYYVANFRSCSKSVFEGLYESFPAPKQIAVTAVAAPASVPAAAPAAAPPATPAAATSALAASKPQDDSANVAKAAPVPEKGIRDDGRPQTASGDGKVSGFMLKPSVGTWAAFPRGPKLVRGAASAC